MGKASVSAFACAGDRPVNCRLSESKTGVAEITSFNAVTAFYELASEGEREVCTHECKLACFN
ncbi:MAG TPA: hypothetical protein PKA31_00080 [Candidatus Moranbacteria bacterium]|nr:hypothetical protein [Candidatus Moranbacteria bacterium]